MRRAAVALLLAGAVLSGCGEDDPSGSSSEPVGGRPDTVSGDTSSVLVPTGTVELEVGEPQDEVSEDEAGDGTTHEAPDGTTYVGVDWQYLPGHGLPTFAASLMADDQQTVRLTLVAGGKRYALGETPADAGDVFVPVEGSGEDVSIEVEFADETQAVDARTGDRSPGVFAPLYELDEGEPLTCSGLRAKRGTTDATCNGLALTVPWLPGTGWSASGWAAVQVTTATTAYRVNRSDYDVEEVRDASTVDGEQPRVSWDVSNGPGRLTHVIVAEAPVEAVDVVRVGDALLQSGTGPEHLSYELVATIRP